MLRQRFRKSSLLRASKHHYRAQRNETGSTQPQRRLKRSSVFAMDQTTNMISDEDDEGFIPWTWSAFRQRHHFFNYTGCNVARPHCPSGPTETKNQYFITLSSALQHSFGACDDWLSSLGDFDNGHIIHYGSPILSLLERRQCDQHNLHPLFRLARATYPDQCVLSFSCRPIDKKAHRNGIKKVKTQRHPSLKGVCPKFIRNQRFAKKGSAAALKKD